MTSRGIYAGRQPISGGILRELQKNVGLPVHADDLIKNVGLHKREQISPAISYLKSEKGFDIETVIAGYSWRLRNPRAEEGAPAPATPAAQAKRLFEELGVTKTGAVIAQDQDGALYKLEEL